MLCVGFFNAGTQALLHCAPLVAFFSVLDATADDRLKGVVAEASAAPATNSSSNSARMAELRVRLVEDFSTLVAKTWGGRFKLCVPKDLLQGILTLNPFFRGEITGRARHWRNSWLRITEC